MSIATTDKWKNQAGEAQEKTEWHKIVVWGKLGELCAQYLDKGRQCLVEGKIETRSWDDEQGNKRYATEIRADQVVFLGGPNGSNENN